MEQYESRIHAGEILASHLERNLGKDKNLLVLGIPRGGIPIAYVIALLTGIGAVVIDLLQKEEIL